MLYSTLLHKGSSVHLEKDKLLLVSSFYTNKVLFEKKLNSTVICKKNNKEKENDNPPIPHPFRYLLHIEDVKNMYFNLIFCLDQFLQLTSWEYPATPFPNIVCSITRDQKKCFPSSPRSYAPVEEHLAKHGGEKDIAPDSPKGISSNIPNPRTVFNFSEESHGGSITRLRDPVLQCYTFL